MPVSIWKTRKCSKCGAKVLVIIGDCLDLRDLRSCAIPFICEDCRKREGCKRFSDFFQKNKC